MSAELHKLLMETIISSSPEESKDNTNIVNGKTMIISLVLSPQTGTIHGRTRSALERPNEKKLQHLPRMVLEAQLLEHSRQGIYVECALCRRKLQ